MDFGPELRRHRHARRLSQLALSLEANVSTRHLSYLETERAQPSRELVVRLGRALQLSLRDINRLLLAAGYAPAFAETPLDAAPMTEVRRAVELLLRRNDPFAAVAFDAAWDIVMVNEGYARFLSLLFGSQVEPFTLVPRGEQNVVRQFFSPQMRAVLVNWHDTLEALLPRLQRDRSRAPGRLGPVLDEVLAGVGAPAGGSGVPSLVIPLTFELAGARLGFFTTVASLGTPTDVTLDELQIESLHPADGATDAFVRAWEA